MASGNGAMVKGGGGGQIERLADYVKQNQAALKQVAAEQVDVRRLYRLVVNIVRQTPGLMKCAPASIFKAMQQAAEVGLEPGGALGHSYILPYGEEAQFLIGYRGFLELARRSGRIATFQAFAVYEGDKFDVKLGDSPSIEHVPNWDGARSDDKLRYVYAIARMTDGSIYLDVMTRGDVEKVRSRSRAAKNGPWVTDYAEMSKKTVVRRLSKYLPLSIQMARAVEIDEVSELGPLAGVDVTTIPDEIAAKEQPKALTETKIEPAAPSAPNGLSDDDDITDDLSSLGDEAAHGTTAPVAGAVPGAFN